MLPPVVSPELLVLSGGWEARNATFFGVWPSLVRRLLWEQKISGVQIPPLRLWPVLGNRRLIVAKVVLPFQCDAEKLEEMGL